MANTSRPAGLIPYRQYSGGIPLRLGSYDIISGQSGSIFQGDPVSLNAAAATANAGRQIQVAGVTTTSLVLGAFMGVRYTAADGSLIWSNRWINGTTMATGTVGEAFVYDDPDQVYLIQNGGAGLLVSQIGLGAEFVIGTGNSSTGISGCILADPPTTGAHQVQIMDLVKSPDNDYGASSKCLVRLMTAQWRGAVGV